ncbi:MAG: penicillin-binding protein 1C [Oceanospirillum sp.]|nr:penicillin-binding protein 1C [Oceanospirillum sp.]
MNTLKKTLAVMVVITLLPALLFSAADKLWPLTLPGSDRQPASVVLDRHGQPLRYFADQEGIWRHRVSVDQVSDDYLQALLAYEDRFFYQHPGINPLSLLRALGQFVRHGRVISGGSTLTMQVARILDPHSRSVAGKLWQMFRALQLEQQLSKVQILELYLNYAPFGGVLEGIQAASFHYLSKPAHRLRPAEAALMAVLPQAPSRYRPDRYPQRAEEARNKVLDRLSEQGVWDKPKVLRAKQEPVDIRPMDNPLVAPHLAYRLYKATPETSVHYSTLDQQLQLQVESRLAYGASVMGREVSAAALVIDNRNHNVLAYAGSADFLAKERQGQVDMVQAVRSPGSSLKPFLYGLALDKSLIHSQSLLADVPFVSQHYQPENFNRHFSGPVSASQALQLSLNLPFVQLIEAYGAQNFMNRLLSSGIDLSVPGGEGNPAMILGGAGIQLEHLVRLYASLANQGKVPELKFSLSEADSGKDNSRNTKDDRSDWGHHLSDAKQTHQFRHLLSPQAAWITWDTLRAVRIPTSAGVDAARRLSGQIGWKTGTSWGHRDAWAIGVSQNYTIGVWVGRADGRPMTKGRTGYNTSGPILFDLFRAISPRVSPVKQPEGIQEHVICWPDGRSEAVVRQCDQSFLALTIRGVTPRTLDLNPEQLFYDPSHTILLDQNTGLRVNRACLQGEVEKAEVSLWPDFLAPWLPSDKKVLTRLPEWAGQCLSYLNDKRDIHLSGVKPGQVFLLKKDSLVVPVKLEQGFVARHWYLNGNRIAGNASQIKLKLSLETPEHNELLVIGQDGWMIRLPFYAYKQD